MTNAIGVTPEQFETVRAAFQEADDALTDAYNEFRHLRKTLQTVACGAEFTIPDDDLGHGDITETCLRAPDHTGTHDEDPRPGDHDTAHAAYRVVYRGLDAAQTHLQATHERFRATPDPTKSPRSSDSSSDAATRPL